MLVLAIEGKFKRSLRTFYVSELYQKFMISDAKTCVRFHSKFICCELGSLFPSWLPGQYAILFSRPFPEVRGSFSCLSNELCHNTE